MDLVISIKEINEIIEKYNIGKRPLSIILGFGEITITRYLDGYPITKQKSNNLKEILNSPEEFLKYLEKNKDDISNIAYAKSKRSVEKLLNIKFDNDNELENVSDYIVRNNDDITNLSLQKLLYYCQLFSYVIMDKPMFVSPCSAWDHGPVYKNIYYKYKANGSELINNINIPNTNINNKELVDEILKDFGCFSGKVLCFFTHTEETWKKGYQAIDNTISDEDMIELAKTIKNKYNINSISDISKYSEALMNVYKSEEMKWKKV